MKQDKGLKALLIVAALALFIVAIALPATNTKAGLATADYFEAKSRNDAYRDRLGVSYNDFVREPTKRDVEYSQKRQVRAEQEAWKQLEQELAKHPLEKTPRGFRLGSGGPKGNCLPLTQAGLAALEWGPTGKAIEGCYEMVENIDTSDYGLVLLSESTLDCQGHTLTYDGYYSLRLHHNAELTNCEVVFDMYHSWPLIVTNAIVSDSSFTFADWISSNLITHNMVIVGGGQVTNVDLDIRPIGKGIQFQHGDTYEVQNTEVVLDNVHAIGDGSASNGFIAVFGELDVPTTLIDTVVSGTLTGMNLRGLDVTFDNAKSCNNDLDFLVDEPGEYGSSYVGEVEADTYGTAAGLYPGLDISACSNIWEAEESEGWYTEGVLGDDDDDGDDWEAEESSGVFTVGE